MLFNSLTQKYFVGFSKNFGPNNICLIKNDYPIDIALMAPYIKVLTAPLVVEGVSKSNPLHFSFGSTKKRWL